MVRIAFTTRHRVRRSLARSFSPRPQACPLGGSKGRATLPKRNRGVASYTWMKAASDRCIHGADSGSTRDDQRSIGRYLVKIGCGVVDWKSKKQSCVALSSAEAALCQGSEGMVKFLRELVISVHDAMVVNTENQGSMDLANNPVIHNRSKDIDIQYHFTRDLVKERWVSLNYMPTQGMITALLSKALPMRSMNILLGTDIGLG